jgi:CRISPR-associated protein Csh1
MEENQEQTVHLTAEEFINQHLEFFDSQYKIGVFLLGYLSAYLMGKQYKKLKSNPFMKQLNSLNIDEKTIQGILPKLINKLREYDSAIPEMEQKIAKCLVTESKLSKTEISYTFTLGLIMQKEFAKAYSR